MTRSVLRELFDNAFPWDKRQSDTAYVYAFDIPATESSDESDAIVKFAVEYVPNPIDFRLTFKRRDTRGEMSLFPGYYGDSKEAKRLGFRILATVVDIISDFLRTVEPNSIIFWGVTKEQQSLYDLMLKNLSDDIKELGYTVKKKRYDRILQKKKRGLF